MSLDQYSTTPASNDLLNYFQTGMRPSAVKTAGWDIMADMAQLWNALPTGGGSANAQTVANPRPFASLTTGLTCIYLPNFVNTGAATFAPDGLTAKNIFAGGVALAGFELQKTTPAWLKYDGTQWNLLNPCMRRYGVASGTNAITVTIPEGPPGMGNGFDCRIKVANTITGSPTLSINGGGAVTIYYSDGVTPLAAGALIAGRVYNIINDITTGGYVCTNPSRVTGSFTLTISNSYLTLQQTGTINYAIQPDGKTVWVRNTANIQGTSNSTTMIGTGVPTLILPVTTTSGAHRPMYLGKDSGSAFFGAFDTGTSGSWTFFGNSTLTTGAFTGSGTKGVSFFESSFTLD